MSSEVAAIQHDADKIVVVSRSGKLRACLLREIDQKDRANRDDLLAAITRARGSASEIAPRDPLWPSMLEDDEDRMDEGHMGDLDVLDEPPVLTRPVRFYVSSVSYGKGVLVHDGRDDELCVLFTEPPLG